MFNKKPLDRYFLNLCNFCNYRNYYNDRRDKEQHVDESTIVLYDHECPLCRQEMERLKSLDHENRLTLLSIHSGNFDEKHWGVTKADASRALYVLTAEKIWLVGMPAIRHVYSQVDLGWLMSISGWPIISGISDLAYRYIAPNRYAISRWLGLGKSSYKCTDNKCTVKN